MAATCVQTTAWQNEPGCGPALNKAALLLHAMIPSEPRASSATGSIGSSPAAPPSLDPPRRPIDADALVGMLDDEHRAAFRTLARHLEENASLARDLAHIIALELIAARVFGVDGLAGAAAP